MAIQPFQMGFGDTVPEQLERRIKGMTVVEECIDREIAACQVAVHLITQQM